MQSSLLEAVHALGSKLYNNRDACMNQLLEWALCHFILWTVLLSLLKLFHCFGKIQTLTTVIYGWMDGWIKGQMGRWTERHMFHSELCLLWDLIEMGTKRNLEIYKTGCLKEKLDSTSHTLYNSAFYGTPTTPKIGSLHLCPLIYFPFSFVGILNFIRKLYLCIMLYAKYDHLSLVIFASNENSGLICFLRNLLQNQ